ncbi:MAG: hypothetical protein HOW73_26415 [Polyangiaceae bacterium]|nr:hypothetical protein [Polyangiaceae bacterium]
MGAVLKDKESAVVVDDAARGILIASWFGEPTVELVDQYYSWHGAFLDRHRKERRRFILITDTYASTRPSPAARKRIADGFKSLGPDVRDFTFQSYIIVHNALIRGVLTALGWLDERLSESVIVATPADAIEGALKDLEKAGIPRPANLSPQGYRRPARPKEASRETA